MIEDTRTIEEAEVDAIDVSSERLLDFYRPTYFLFGPEDQEVKFRVSIKARLLKAKTSDPRDTVRFFFGYTQTSYWKVGEDSSPFRETDYNPEFFLSWRRDRPAPVRGWRLFRVRLGAAHESNGRDAEASRSWNYLFIEPHFMLKRKGRDHNTLQLSTRIWPLVDLGSQNRDLLDFFGHGEVALAARSGRFSGHLAGRIGESGNRGGASLSLSWQTSDDSPFHLTLQAWSGYGENLLDYNVKDTNLRLGILITR